MFSLQDKCIVEMYNKQHILEGVSNRLINEIKILYKYVDSSHLNKIENVDILLKYKFILLEIMLQKYNFYDCLGLVPKEFLKDEEFMSEIKNTKFYEIDRFPENEDGFYTEDVFKHYLIRDNFIEDCDIEWNALILGYVPEKYRIKKQLLKKKVNDKITIYSEINNTDDEISKVKIKGNRSNDSYSSYLNTIYRFWIYGYHPSECDNGPDGPDEPEYFLYNDHYLQLFDELDEYDDLYYHY